MKSIAITVFSAFVLSASIAVSAGDEDEEHAVKAIAEIRGCTDPNIVGSAGLIERPSGEGVKLVDIRLRVRGLPDGNHAVQSMKQASVCPVQRQAVISIPVRMETPLPMAITRITREI